MSRPIAFLPAVVVLLVILALTLTPDAGVEGTVRLDLQLVGDRGIADAIANILLFVPFGAAVMVGVRSWRSALLAGACLSLFIEVTQLLIPGRFTSPGDLAFNTLGTAIGVVLVRRPDLWLRPSPRRSEVLGWSALAAALLVLIGGSRLFASSFHAGPLWGQWTPERAPAGAYQGTVTAARVGPLPIRGDGELDSPAAVRRLLLQGDTLHVALIAAAPTPERLGIVNVADSRDVIFGLAAEGEDVVLGWRMRASDLSLDQPRVRFAGGLRGVVAGDAVSLAAWRQDRLYCIAVNDREQCGMGLSPAATWGLLLFPLPRPLATAMPYLWLVALLAPAGFWATGAARLAAMAGVAVIALTAVPPGTAVTAVSAAELVAACAALAAGFGARSWAGAASTRAARNRTAGGERSVLR